MISELKRGFCQLIVVDEKTVRCFDFKATLTILDLIPQGTLNDENLHSFFLERFQSSLSGDFEDKRHNLTLLTAITDWDRWASAP